MIRRMDDGWLDVSRKLDGWGFMITWMDYEWTDFDGCFGGY